MIEVDWKTVTKIGLGVSLALAPDTSLPVLADCPIPAAPKNLSVWFPTTVQVEPTGTIQKKNPPTPANFSWEPTPGAKYHFRLTKKIDSVVRSETQTPDVTLNNLTENHVFRNLPDPILRSQSYGAWVHVEDLCGVSEATGISFTLNWTENIVNDKPPVINN